jgi:hypothetical protein
MSIKQIKPEKLLKKYYQAEIKKIPVPKCPLARPQSRHHGITAAILSFSLIAASLFYVTCVLITEPALSPLAKKISRYSKDHTWDSTFSDGIKYLKTAYSLKDKEEQ